MLAISRLVKNFGNVKALAGASLHLAEGETRALLGSNGSGKSTLVKILSGLYIKDGGTIEIDGRPAEIRSSFESIRLGISTAYQDLSLIPGLTVADNMVIGNEPGRFGTIRKRTVFEYAEMMIDKLDIKTRPSTVVSELDLSNQSLVEVAKALYSGPKILILDEITASMHYDQVQNLFSFLGEYTAGGRSVLFVSHRFEEVYRLCETATVLREGANVKDLPLKDASPEELVSYMAGKPAEKTKSAASGGFEAARPVLSVNSLGVAGKVKGASIRVGYGEIVGIAGLEGQGQAEFLRALYGVFPFTGGVEFEGKPVKIKSPGEAVKKGIGFISGDRDREGIFPVRSVTENILIAHNAAGPVFSFLSEKKQKEQSKTVIEQLRILSAGTGTPANSLSGGNQQKLLVGRWLFMKPKLLLLDDPTKGVDINAREEINSLLRDMTKTGMAVIFSSSDNEELLRMASRIYVFYEHKIVSELSDKSLNGKILAETMLGART